MAEAIDNPTVTLLKYFTGGPDPQGDQPTVGSTRGDDEGDPSELSDEMRSDHLIGRFAELVGACRRADLSQAGATIDAIKRSCEDFAPELTELARSLLAEAGGDFQAAEAHTSACLRQTHRSPEVTRPIALVERATHRLRLGLLDAALNDLAEADAYGRSILSLHSVAIRALIHWWRGDQGQALDALEQGPRYLIQGLDLGVGWFALAAELVKNGQIFEEDLGHTDDCLAREFWDARSEQVAGAYVATLGPHLIRHEIALGNDPAGLLTELNTGADPGTATGKVYRWCVALAERDSAQLADIADGHRDSGAILAAIEAYRDAAACADDDDDRDRLTRRGRFFYDRLSRAVKVSSATDLPSSVARELTEAEQNVVSAVARGLSNKEAADELHCSVRTIESHLTSAYKKLGVKRRTQLAVLIAQANVSNR